MALGDLHVETLALWPSFSTSALCLSQELLTERLKWVLFQTNRGSIRLALVIADEKMQVMGVLFAEGETWTNLSKLSDKM